MDTLFCPVALKNLLIASYANHVGVYMSPVPAPDVSISNTFFLQALYVDTRDSFFFFSCTTDILPLNSAAIFCHTSSEGSDFCDWSPLRSAKWDTFHTVE